MAVGDIGAAIIDSLEIYGNSTVDTTARAGGICHARDDFFCQFYFEGSGAGGNEYILATFTCDSSGNLGASVTDTIVVDTRTVGSIPELPNIIKVANGIVAVMYFKGEGGTGTNDAHIVKTFSVSIAGILSLVDTETITDDDPLNSFCRLRATHHTDWFVALSGRTGGSPLLQAKSLQIDSLGNIFAVSSTKTITHPVGGGNLFGGFVDIARGNGNYYVLAWTEDSGTPDGYLTSFLINADGTFGSTADELEFKSDTDAERRNNLAPRDLSKPSDKIGFCWWSDEVVGSDQVLSSGITVDTFGVLGIGSNQVINTGAQEDNDIITIDSVNFNFLAAFNSRLESFSLDASGNPTEIDNSGSIFAAGDWQRDPHLVIVPGVDIALVSGLSTGAGEFDVNVFSISVETNFPVDGNFGGTGVIGKFVGAGII